MPQYLPLPTTPHRPPWAAKLTDREEKFVLEFASTLNAGAAALAAGFAKGNRKSAVEIGSRIRRRPHVADALAMFLHDAVDVTRMRVLEEIAKVAFSTWADHGTIADDGTLVLYPHATLNADQLATVANVEQRINESGYRTLHVKLHDKMSALALLTKILGMQTTKHRVETTVSGKIEVEHTHAIADRVRARLDELASRQSAPMLIDVTPSAAVVVPAEVR